MRKLRVYIALAVISAPIISNAQTSNGEGILVRPILIEDKCYPKHLGIHFSESPTDQNKYQVDFYKMDKSNYDIDSCKIEEIKVEDSKGGDPREPPETQKKSLNKIMY